MPGCTLGRPDEQSAIYEVDALGACTYVNQISVEGFDEFVAPFIATAKTVQF
jgi:hypothetical protein